MREYINQGGIVVGVSGGAVQLGKSTKLFQMFIEDSDDTETLKIVDFEFLPHYNRWNDDYKSKVYKYATKTGTKIYAANDGDGNIVEDKNVQMIGDIILINK